MAVPMRRNPLRSEAPPPSSSSRSRTFAHLLESSGGGAPAGWGSSTGCPRWISSPPVQGRESLSLHASPLALTYKQWRTGGFFLCTTASPPPDIPPPCVPLSTCPNPLQEQEVLGPLPIRSPPSLTFSAIFLLLLYLQDAHFYPCLIDPSMLTSLDPSTVTPFFSSNPSIITLFFLSDA